MPERRFPFVVSLAVALALCAAFPACANDLYLTFENPQVIGSGTGAHANEIPLISFQQTVKSGKGGTFTIRSYMGRHTDDVLKLCWNAREIGKAVVRLYQTVDGKETLRVEYVLQQVLITNFAITGGVNDMPAEELTLEASSVQFNAYFARPDGSMSTESAQITGPRREH